jgi:hypothetical protein
MCTADATTSPGTVYYIDCSGNPLEFEILSGVSGLFCGKLGTITSNGPLISIVGACTI